MHGRHLGAAALLSLALGVASVAPAQAASASTSSLVGGVNVVGINSGATVAEADRNIAEAQELHAKIVRVEAPWSQFEPQGQGQINPHTQAFADRLIDDAAAAGIKVILIAERTPCWASAAPSREIAKCRPLQESAANAWPPRDPSTYAAF